MVFEHIEKLKQEYTDKYVIVDDSRPELRRFVGATGTVRTVNMSGRALVEFDAYDNIGWYDIDIDFLRIIEKPIVKEEPKAAAKPAGKAKPAAKGKKPAVEKTSAKPMSPADILAAARGGKAAGADDKAKPAAAAGKTPPQQMSAADILAAARGGKATGDSEAAKKKADPKPPAAAKPKAKAAGSASQVDPSKMSAADILAAARGQGAGSAPPAVETTDDDIEMVEEEVVAEEPVTEPVAEEPTATAPAADDGPLPTDIDAILAFCRQRDGS